MGRKRKVRSNNNENNSSVVAGNDRSESESSSQTKRPHVDANITSSNGGQVCKLSTAIYCFFQLI